MVLVPGGSRMLASLTADIKRLSGSSKGKVLSQKIADNKAYFKAKKLRAELLLVQGRINMPVLVPHRERIAEGILAALQRVKPVFKCGCERPFPKEILAVACAARDHAPVLRLLKGGSK